MLRKILLLLLVCLTLLANSSFARDTLDWLTDEIKPAYILGGDDSEMGFADQQLRLAIAHLPDFEHHIFKGDSARILHDLTHRTGACTISMAVSPMRELLLAFSTRSIALPGYRLIVKASRTSEFEALKSSSGEIDLAKLAANRRMRGVYLRGLAYPTMIQDYVNDPGNRATLQAQSQGQALINLVAFGRVDYSFATALEIDYHNRALAAGERLTALPITGVAAEFLTAPACSADPAGRAAIAGLDHWLSDAQNWTNFLEPLRPWLGEEGFRRNLMAPPR